MTEQTEAGGESAESLAREPSAPVDSERPNADRRAVKLFGVAGLLSTTALLPFFDTKTPPYKGD